MARCKCRLLITNATYTNNHFSTPSSQLSLEMRQRA